MTHSCCRTVGEFSSVVPAIYPHILDIRGICELDRML